MFLIDRISFELELSPEDMTVEYLDEYVDKFGEPNYNDLLNRYSTKKKIETKLIESIENNKKIEEIMSEEFKTTILY